MFLFISTVSGELNIVISRRISSSLQNHLHNKRRYVYQFVCLLPMAGRTAGPIKTKPAIGTHVDPKSVLGKVKVKVIYRGPHGRDNSVRNLQLVLI